MRTVFFISVLIFIKTSIISVKGQVVINEVITDPQQDWSSASFTTSPGGVAGSNDEWIELYILTSGLDLTNWTIELNDASPVVGDLTSSGAFDVSNYLSSGVGTFTNTQAGDYLVLGNVASSGAMSNTITIVLKNQFGEVVDQVIIGGGMSNAPNGNADNIANESICRLGNGKDTDDDRADFYQTVASLGKTNTPEGQVVINEVVTSPQSDWSSHGFNGIEGREEVTDGVDEYVELYIKSTGMNLTGYTIELLDGSDVIGDIKAGGAFQVSNYVTLGSGTRYQTEAGDYLVLGNVHGSEAMNNTTLMQLKDASGNLVDEVRLGSMGFPSGNSTDKSNEAVSRFPNGVDTDSGTDFIDSYASPGTVNANTPLPIQLLSFSAEVINGSVQLYWQTTMELNNDYFSVEKSFDGESWESVVRINSSGNSVQIKGYSAMDLFPAAELVYYRLKQVDFNGDFEYSTVIAVQVYQRLKNQLQVFPNPVKNSLYIKSETSKNFNLMKVKLLDGRDVTTVVKVETLNERTCEIDLSFLPTGVYVIELDSKMYRIQKD